MSLLLLFPGAQVAPAAGGETGGLPIGLHYDRLTGLMWPRREDFPALTDEEWEHLLLMLAALYN